MKTIAYKFKTLNISFLETSINEKTYDFGDQELDAIEFLAHRHSILSRKSDTVETKTPDLYGSSVVTREILSNISTHLN